MVKKSENTILTYKEILVLAIKGVNQEIDLYNKMEEGQNEEGKELINMMIAPLNEKIEKIKTLYRIETGTDYE